MCTLVIAALIIASPANAMPFGINGPSEPPGIEVAPAEMPGRTATLTKVTNEKSLAGIRRVAVGEVQIEYVKRSLGLTRQERTRRR